MREEEGKKICTEVNGMKVTADGKRIRKALPFVGARRLMAENLSRSWQENAHCLSFNKVDMTAVTDMKRRFAEEGRRVSYTDIFIRLTAAAVQRHPLVNVSLTEKKLEIYDNVNVGVAVATAQGMVLTPVIHDAETKSVFAISDELKQAADAIRGGTVDPEMFTGGTVTVSSLGSYDILGFGQILVRPQSLILGFGSVKKEAAVLDDDSIGIRPMMYISGTTDHRAIQGIALMEFYQTFFAMFRNPEPYMVPDTEQV